LLFCGFCGFLGVVAFPRAARAGGGGGGGGGGRPPPPPTRWNLGDVLTGVLLAHLVSAGNHLEELGELDGVVAVVVDVGDHLLELLVLDLEAKGAHCRRA